jgi:hypothetical protein
MCGSKFPFYALQFIGANNQNQFDETDSDLSVTWLNVWVQYNNSIQFNSLLFVCPVNSYKANNSNNNSILYYLYIEWNLKGHLQVEHSTDSCKYITEKHNKNSSVDYREVQEETQNNAEKQRHKQENQRR